ncbi:hypothetical protein [Staphylococcus phage vB_SauM-V1SA22]|nr:hypothetical protein [Staphylococcus phage vB_SauM-V1SA22]UVT34826.1 hypothetical protein [Staphylococcus phage vB_SauM-V1SA20]
MFSVVFFTTLYILQYKLIFVKYYIKEIREVLH